MRLRAGFPRGFERRRGKRNGRESVAEEDGVILMK